MSELITPEVTTLVVNFIVLICGLALKSYAPMIFPFFDKNQDVIKELLHAINIMPEDNKAIAERAEKQGLTKAATHINKL